MAAVRAALPAANTTLFPTEGATTAKPKALQPRAEVQAERRPQMHTTRGPDRGHTQACLATMKGPQLRACTGIMAVARGLSPALDGDSNAS
jgi:hypothetical protein